MSDILFRSEELVKEPGISAADIYMNDASAVASQEVLCAQMTALLSLGEDKLVASRQQSNFDGSDSGLDMAITAQSTQDFADPANVSLPNGMTTRNYQGETAPDLNMSGNSSLISCDSDLYDCNKGNVKKYKAQTHNQNHHATSNYECCSDNGSESSSIQGTIATTMSTRRLSNVKKKVAMFEPSLKANSNNNNNNITSKDSFAMTGSGVPAMRNPVQSSRRSTGGVQLQRAVSLPRSTQPTSLRLPRERFTDKFASPLASKNSLAPSAANQTSLSAMTTPNRHSPINVKPQKPDSLPNPLNRKHSVSMQRLVQRTPSLSRARTPGTPSDDGRWPSVTQNRSTASRRGMSVTPDMSSLKMRSSLLGASMDPSIKNSSNNIPASVYSTLPRRRKQQSIEDLSSSRGSRSNSVSRESRMTSSVILNTRKSLINTYSPANSQNANQKAPRNSSTSSTGRKSLQAPITRTKIYHETSVQTALTNEDLERAFSGHVRAAPSIDVLERREQATQSDIGDRELERLSNEVSHLKKREQDLLNKLQRERDEKYAMQKELTMNTEKVLGMLEMARYISCNAGTPSSEDGESHDSLLMLESQIQISGHELIEKHKEIGNLRKLCLSLQKEIESSVTARKTLLEEKNALEQESSELQDFLQHEKAALCEALKDMEAEYQNSKQLLANRDEEIKVLRDECRHLVRLNEQRRQENRMWQTKYNALETKSKEMILQQNNSVAGASTALSGLHTRLDSLVEQLVFSYNISDNDLELISSNDDGKKH